MGEEPGSRLSPTDEAALVHLGLRDIGTLYSVTRSNHAGRKGWERAQGQTMHSEDRSNDGGLSRLSPSLSVSLPGYDIWIWEFPRGRSGAFLVQVHCKIAV